MCCLSQGSSYELINGDILLFAFLSHEEVSVLVEMLFVLWSQHPGSRLPQRCFSEPPSGTHTFLCSVCSWQLCAPSLLRKKTKQNTHHEQKVGLVFHHIESVIH